MHYRSSTFAHLHFEYNFFCDWSEIFVTPELDLRLHVLCQRVAEVVVDELAEVDEESVDIGVRPLAAGAHQAHQRRGQHQAHLDGGTRVEFCEVTFWEVELCVCVCVRVHFWP